jgi:hypothetical protein
VGRTFQVSEQKLMQAIGEIAEHVGRGADGITIVVTTASLTRDERRR